MNIFAFLTVFFATVATVLLYALIASHDTNKVLRAAFNRLHRAKLAQDSHLEAGSELLYHCQMLERRNEYLEMCMLSFRDIVAGAKLRAPGHINEDEQFTVRDTGRVP